MALNGKVINGNVINGSDGLSFLQTLSIASTSAVSILKQISKTLTTFSNTIGSLTKVIAHYFSLISEPNTTSLTKQAGVNRSITSSSTTTLSRQINKFITYLSISVSSLVKQISKTLSYVSTSVANVFKGLFRLLSVSSSNTTTLTKISNKSFSYLSTSTSSLIKSVGKLVTTNIDHVVVVLTDIALHLVAISYLVTDTVTISKAITKAINYTVSSVVIAGIGRAKILFITVQGLPVPGGSLGGFINGAAINLNAINAGVSNAISYTNSYLTSLVKQVNKKLSILEITVDNLVPIRAKILSIVSTSSVRITKAISKTLLAISTSVVTLLTNMVPLFGAVFRDSIYAPIRKRAISLIENRSIAIGLFKNRLTSLVKSRTVSKVEDFDG